MVISLSYHVVCTVLIHLAAISWLPVLGKQLFARIMSYTDVGTLYAGMKKKHFKNVLQIFYVK